MSPLKYDTVLFDADGTLLDFHRSERESLVEALRQIGVTPTDKIVAEYSQINDSLWKLLERGEIEKSVLFYHRFELLFEQFGIHADPKQVAEDYMERMCSKGYLLEGADALCARLQGKVRLYIVTNGTGFIQRGRCAVSGLGQYFEDSFISDVIGVEKPHRAFFEYVAAHIPDFDPEKTLIVGDSLTSDMQGGVNFGIDTCWYNPDGKALSEALAGKLTYVVDCYDAVYDVICGQGESR
ncbi:MAG: YjjG family noncanonical pyrimidine nucleotidase [Clostridia bacterium]|nr:YjjG family noncanonical pyrimidine nucleotidase [Clostridia bacterium]